MIELSKNNDDLLDAVMAEINKLGVPMGHLERELIRAYIGKGLIQAMHLGHLEGIEALSNKLREDHQNG
jgi:hypothetical protein